MTSCVSLTGVIATKRVVSDPAAAPRGSTLRWSMHSARRAYEHQVVHSSDPRLLEAMSLAGPHAADILGLLLEAMRLARPHAADILGLLLQVKPVHVVFEANPDESVHRGRGPHYLSLHFSFFSPKTSKNEAEIDVRPEAGALVDQGIWVLVPRISAASWTSSLNFIQ